MEGISLERILTGIPEKLKYPAILDEYGLYRHVARRRAKTNTGIGGCRALMNHLSEKEISRGSLLKGLGKAALVGAAAGMIPGAVLSSDAKAASNLEKTYTPSSSNFPNPERGWLVGIDPLQRDYYSGGRLLRRGNTTMPRNPPAGFEKYALTTQKLQQHRAEGVTLIRKYYLLYDYRNSAIPQSYLTDTVAADFNVIRQNGMKIIPRFIYVWNESYEQGAGRDASVDRIVSHLDQLAPILREHADVISFLEAGLVGWYGEWHNSQSNNVGGEWRDAKTGANYNNALNANSMRIINKALDVLPTKRMMVLRLPHHLAQLHQDVFPGDFTNEEAYSGTDESRVGFEDSSVMFSDTHRGGYWPPNSDFGRRAKASMRAFQSETTRNVVMTGEPSGIDQSGFLTKSDPFVELATMHWDAMNNCWYEAEVDGVYDFWKRRGAYGEIGSRLGYRFSLLGASLTPSAAPGGVVTLTFDIRNSGFSSPYNRRPVELVLRRVADGREYRVAGSADPRRWKSGTQNRVTISGSLPADAATGNYEAFLNFPDPEPRLYERSEYAIRLANDGLWENATGFNRLGLTVSVGGSSANRSAASSAAGFEPYERAARTDEPAEITFDITDGTADYGAFDESSTRQTAALANGDVRLNFSQRAATPSLLRGGFGGINWGTQSWQTLAIGGVKCLTVRSRSQSVRLVFDLPQGKVLKGFDLLKRSRSGSVNKIVVNSAGNPLYVWENPAPWWATHQLTGLWNTASRRVTVTISSNGSLGVGNLAITNIIYGNATRS